MIKFKSIVVLFLMLFVNAGLMAQGTDDIQMADALRQDGKIWVVVGVIIFIFIGIGLYLVRLERKIDKLEREVESRKK